jgi:zinc/manganese transport system permease protein
MNRALHALFEQGLWQSNEVGTALLIGAVIAAISGAMGVFVVIRGQSFVGHVLTDIGTAGASGAYLVGLNAWYGLISFGTMAGVGVEMLGDRARNRDIATGMVLSFALGVGALFLYFDTQFTTSANASMLILFGSIFVVNPALVPVIVGLSALTAAILVFLYRPLLLCSVNPEIAKVRGVPVRFVSVIFVIFLALTVENGALVIGSLLSTALLIGPAAAATRMTSKIGIAILLSAMIGTVTTAVGIVLAYDSYAWLPSHRGWPVSFFISVLIFIIYLFSGLRTSSRKSQVH